MIKIKPFRQTPGYCGPASLKMVMDYYGVCVLESEIAKVAGATKEKGVSAYGLARAAKYFRFKPLIKKNSTLSDLEKFVKNKIPVIVNWFCEDDGHYSVVADITRRDILLIDPSLKKGKRMMPKKDFYRVWFDFYGDYIRTPKDLLLRLMVVVIPKK